MRRFTIGQMAWLRRQRSRGASFTGLLARHGHQFTRAELVEMWDASVRCPTDHDAADRVNYVLGEQEAKVPLINGKPATAVLSYNIRRPMF